MGVPMTDNGKPPKQCFVVGPIGEPLSEVRNHADWLLLGIIEPVFNEHFRDFDVIRSDKIADPGMIDSQVIGRLLDAELVIADMSFLNANAFYEIGIRHMVRKPIIHMFRAGEVIPFDVKPYRAISFARIHPSDIQSAKDQLKAAISAVLAAGYQVENPVTRTRGDIKLEEHATPEQRVLIDQIRKLEDRIVAVESGRSVVTRGRSGQLVAVTIALEEEDAREMELQREEIIDQVRASKDVIIHEYEVIGNQIEFLTRYEFVPALLKFLSRYRQIRIIKTANV
jgi:hypothetical protein